MLERDVISASRWWRKASTKTRFERLREPFSCPKQVQPCLSPSAMPTQRRERETKLERFCATCRKFRKPATSRPLIQPLSIPAWEKRMLPCPSSRRPIKSTLVNWSGLTSILSSTACALNPDSRNSSTAWGCRKLIGKPKRLFGRQNELASDARHEWA